jgi:hypothetical protein
VSQEALRKSKRDGVTVPKNGASAQLEKTRSETFSKVHKFLYSLVHYVYKNAISLYYLLLALRFMQKKSKFPRISAPLPGHEDMACPARLVLSSTAQKE